MTSAEVQYILDIIDSNWPGPETDLADVPLERIDRDNADLLDDTPIHKHSADLEEMNYVGAASAGRTTSPIGTEYDLQTEPVVGIRLEGAHVSEYGAIDPQGGSHSWPTTTWASLKSNVRRAILADRTFPTPNNSNVGYKDLFIENEADTSSQYSDYYRYDFDVRFSGFEELP